MAEPEQTIHVGTSGWSYSEWIGTFYADGVDPADLLRSYAKHFHAVEINSSFYKLIEKATLRTWRDAVPDDFVFAVKASRYVTHMKKLRDPGPGLTRFLDRVVELGDKLGPILCQLPPNWGRDADRLDAFLAAASREFRYAFEFRDHSWFDREVYDVLGRHDAALCIHDMEGFRAPSELTTDFVYLRMHGSAGRYQGNYDTATLSGLAGAISSWARTGRSVHCYFDNDQKAAAPGDAARLAEMLGVGTAAGPGHHRS